MGVLTTEASKHAMCGLVNSMMREHRIHMAADLVSHDAPSMRVWLREQLKVYSYQYKIGETAFNKDQMILSGKIGGMKDDVAICCQLVVYWSGLEVVSSR